MTLKCGHTFCKECVQDYFRQGSKAANRNEEVGRSTSCPECSQKASKRCMRDSKVMFHQVDLFRQIFQEIEEILDVTDFR